MFNHIFIVSAEEKVTGFWNCLNKYSGIIGIIVTIILFGLTFWFLNRREIKKYKNASNIFFSLLIRGFQDCLVFLDRFDALQGQNVFDCLFQDGNISEMHSVKADFDELVDEPFRFQKEIFDAYFICDAKKAKEFLDDFLDTKVKLYQYQQFLMDENIQKSINDKPIPQDKMREIISAEIEKIKRAEKEYNKKKA